MPGKASSSDTAETVKIGTQDIAPQSVVDELSVALRLNQTSIFKLFHVMRKGGGGDGDALADISTSAGVLVPAAQLLQYLVAPRVCQGTGDKQKLSVGERN